MTEKSLPLQLIEAINSEDQTTLRELIKENSEQLNLQTFMAGQTWLGYACQKGKLAAIAELCELGADLNLGDSHAGAAPICSAADNGHAEAVRYLVARGAELHVDASVRNPLFAAIVGRSPEAVEILLDAGIDAKVIYNSPTMRNMDAVAFALMRGERRCAELIAYRNADGEQSKAERALREADEIAERNAHGRRG